MREAQSAQAIYYPGFSARLSRTGGQNFRLPKLAFAESGRVCDKGRVRPES